MLKKKKLFLLDMDGTIYLDNKVFPGVHALLEYIQTLGGRVLFVTNNSSRNVVDYVRHLHALGIPAVSDDFVTSAQATIRHLQRHTKARRVYCLGTRSLAAELREAGFEIIDHAAASVDTLVMGFDRELTFQKLEDACILLGRGVNYIATNPDQVCPTVYGAVPDCGSVAEMLYNATGRRPDFIGKPAPEMVYMAMERTGFSTEQTLLVGDRIYTDIACGVNAGVDTALVLSGESTIETLEKSRIKPTWIFENIQALYNHLIK